MTDDLKVRSPKYELSGKNVATKGRGAEPVAA